MPHIRCTLSLSACRLASALALAAVAVLGCGEETVSPTAPEPPATLATAATAAPAFFQMSAGNDHSCGVTTDNRAFCWGFYGFSTPVALGDGSTNGSLTPVAVAGGLLLPATERGLLRHLRGDHGQSGLLLGGTMPEASWATAQPPIA